MGLWDRLRPTLNRLLGRARRSPLGFRLVRGTYPGPLDQAHGVLADRWWQELMIDLQGGGYSPQYADPSNVRRPVVIVLDRPVDDRDYIDTSRTGELVGGWYAPFSREIHVPGNYPTTTTTARPAFQALKHEYLHHWFHRVFGGSAMRNGVHDWIMPNGEQLWALQWMPHPE